MTSLIVKKTVRLPRPTDDDRRAHDQRLRDALGLGRIDIPLGLLKRLPASIDFHSPLACILGFTGTGHKLVDIGTDRSYAVALDLGTTNLAALLYDAVSNERVLVRGLENPQIAFGSDILNRLQTVMTGGAEEVNRALRDGVNALIETICADAGIRRNDIHAVAAAGNTVMSHFFLGLDTGAIPVDPFVPVTRSPGFFSASELGLGINPEAVVYVFPNAGSYVGGDITAGILASGMFRSEAVSALIDVGTNAEVVIGNRDWMIVGAGAAGPALEEGISRIGRRARKGIVYDVEIRGDDLSCRTFDEGAPEGICGSGMVSLLYELYAAGMIDKSGTLLPGKLVATSGGERTFTLDCGCRSALSITQSELHNFMKSKAAMFTLLLVLTRAVGLSFRDIAQVYVSGALGTGIDAGKAAGIGMLPAWPPEIIHPLGNSSLEGARMLLADAALLNTIDAIADKITYKPMLDDPEFMKEFRGAVFIPHTNPEMLKVS